MTLKDIRRKFYRIARQLRNSDVDESVSYYDYSIFYIICWRVFTSLSRIFSLRFKRNINKKDDKPGSRSNGPLQPRDLK